jgi:PASTA domain
MQDDLLVAPRVRIAGCVTILIVAGVLSSCSSSPPQVRKQSARTTTTTTTTTSTTMISTTTTLPTASGIPVPNIIGLKLAPARFFLREAGFYGVPLNVPCNKGTLTSESVVASISVPGKKPNMNVGAVPLLPGTPRPKGSFVGITWSGCYPGGSVVPNITGLTFLAAAKLLRVAGLTWACYSVGAATTTSTTHPPTTTPTTATTIPKSQPTVVSQNPPPGSVLRPASPVTMTMHACPQ